MTELAASDLIVHIVTTATLPPGVSGTTRLVTHLGGARHLRVELASSLTLKMRVAILAHELQHACELARSGARTPNAVRALYQTIGRMADGRAERFETGDAERVGRLVWVELGERRARARTVER